jgi:hypothetical protein
MIKVKDVFSHTEVVDGQSKDYLVCKGKLLLLPGDNKQSSLPNYELPYIISESEPVLKGDNFLLTTIKGEIVECLFEGLERSSGYLGCYDKNYGWVYERDIKNKVLVFPNQFIPTTLQQIADGYLYDNQDIYIECDQNTFDGQTVRKDFKVFIADKNSYDPKRALPPLLIKKIVAELKKQHRKYGEKMRADKMGYEPTTKAYKTENLYGDLEFILNHLHL